MATTPPPRATFLESYPEFSKAPAALVDRKLREASSRTASEFYTTDQEIDAVCLKAAVLLAKSPDARKMKLVSDEQAFVWAGELRDLQRSAGMGDRCY